MNILLFPGHGSQFPGMAEKVYAFNKDFSKNIVDNSSDFLNYDICDLICNKENEDVSESVELGSIALYVTSILYFEMIKTKSIKIDFVGGHSFGVYGALYALNMIEFETGLLLAKEWALAVKESSKKECFIAAIIGLDLHTIEKVIDKYNNVWIANENSKYQTVVSGMKEQKLELFSDLEKEGALKIKEIKPNIAFHTPLMENAKKHMKKIFDSINISDPVYPFFTNEHLRPSKDKHEIINSILEQMTKRIKWYQLITVLNDYGVKNAYEVCPGDVLKKICMTITAKIKFKKLFEVSYE